MIRIESKLPSVGTTIFTVMSRLASELGAINLSQGFPDFDCAPELVEIVARCMREGHNQYAPMPGVAAVTHPTSSASPSRPTPDAVAMARGSSVPPQTRSYPAARPALKIM